MISATKRRLVAAGSWLMANEHLAKLAEGVHRETRKVSALVRAETCGKAPLGSIKCIPNAVAGHGVARDRAERSRSRYALTLL